LFTLDGPPVSDTKRYHAFDEIRRELMALDFEVVAAEVSRPGTEVLAIQILRYSEDGLWGRLSALGIVMILISTGLVVLATLIGNRFKITAA